jgi:hypothetical protein
MIGDVVAINFLDHTEGVAEPLEFTVYGKIFVETPVFISVRGWHYTQPIPAVDENDHNVMQWNILKSTITKRKTLIKSKER